MDEAVLQNLKQETEKWVSEGIISGEQAERILGFYETEIPPPQEELKKDVVRWILVLASVLVGLAFFSFIAANWKVLSFSAKFAIIAVSTSLSYFSGWYLREHKAAERSGQALIFLGCLIFGSGIFLVGQAFNTPAYNWPSGFILWLLGTLALAFATDIFALLVLSIALAVIPVIGFPFLILGSEFRNQPFFAPFYLVLLTTLLLFVAGHKIKQREGK
jgi:uncharacterized membrane protein